jgi:hypothetical protein
MHLPQAGTRTPSPMNKPSPRSAGPTQCTDARNDAPPMRNELPAPTQSTAVKHQSEGYMPRTRNRALPHNLQITGKDTTDNNKRHQERLGQKKFERPDANLRQAREGNTRTKSASRPEMSSHQMSLRNAEDKDKTPEGTRNETGRKVSNIEGENSPAAYNLRRSSTT